MGLLALLDEPRQLASGARCFQIHLMAVSPNELLS
jgi:hypothetical protein